MQDEILQIHLSGITGNEDQVDYANIQTDVIVSLKNGQKYLAAFFTFRQIEEVRKWHQQNGGKMSGKYFWAKHLVLIDRCDPDSVEAVVQDLMEEGDFREVFYRIY